MNLNVFHDNNQICFKITSFWATAFETFNCMCSVLPCVNLLILVKTANNLFPLDPEISLVC